MLFSGVDPHEGSLLTGASLRGLPRALGAFSFFGFFETEKRAEKNLAVKTVEGHAARKSGMNTFLRF